MLDGGAFSRLFEVISPVDGCRKSLIHPKRQPVSFAASRSSRAGLVEIRLHIALLVENALPVRIICCTSTLTHPAAPATEDNAVTRAVSSGGEHPHPPGAKRPSSPFGPRQRVPSRSIAHSVTSSFLASATIAI